jgi:hypothetical protein
VFESGLGQPGLKRRESSVIRNLADAIEGSNARFPNRGRGHLFLCLGVPEVFLFGIALAAGVATRHHCIHDRLEHCGW